MAETALRRHRLHVMVDQEDYSSKTERRQEQLQGDMLSMLDEAADAAGLNNASWYRQAGGDSLFAVLPEDAGVSWVIADCILEVDVARGEYNVHLRAEARLRLRIAMVH